MVDMKEAYEVRLAKYFINERQYSDREVSTLDMLYELDRLKSLKGVELLDLLKVSRGQRWRKLKRLEHVGVISQSREPGFAGRGLIVKLTERGREVVKLIKTWEPDLKVKPLQRMAFPKERAKEIEPEEFYEDMFDYDQKALSDFIDESESDAIDVEESGLTKKQRFELEQFLDGLSSEE